MGRRKKIRDSGRAAAPAAAEGGGPGAAAPWLSWGGAALTFVLVGIGLGFLVARWNDVTPGPGPGRGASVPQETGALTPGDATGAGPSSETAARIADLKARLAQSPQEVSIRLALAHLYLDAGRFAEAIPLYQEVLRQEPENPDALMHMGTILHRAGHGPEALRYLDRALKRAPDNPHALWDKAQVQATLLGDDAGALKTWERFLKVAPGPEDAARAREMMAEVRRRVQARPPGRPAVGASVPAADDSTVRSARELLARIGAGPSPGATREAAPRPGAAAAHPGERLFWEKGCGGCHAIGGVGGQMAPDLAGRARGGGRDVAWHVRFLKDPGAVFPGTGMPSYRHLSEQELRTLAEFLVTL